MHILARLSLGKLTALATTAMLGLVIWANGPRMFSPGPLSSQQRGVPAGGVASHADIGGNCAACHSAPWSSESMSDRCFHCHTEVRRQIEDRKSMHGKMPSPRDCRTCHTDHHGDTVNVTRFAHFDHDWCEFALTGKHQGVECRSCHRQDTFKGTPQRCESCHAEPAVHKGQFGTNCAHCHSTLAWDATQFRHSFPVSHGGGKQGRTCATCHTDSKDFRSYTCTNCHRHEPVKTAQKHLKVGIAETTACATCHPFGRRGKK